VRSPTPVPARRRLLQALLGAPLAGLAALPAAGEARDYASAEEVLAEIDRLESDLDARLAALATLVPTVAVFARSVHADHERHRVSRAAIRKRMHVAAGGSSSVAGAAPASRSGLALAQLQSLAQDLVHAHAEGLPAIGDAVAVDVLARAMVDDARHLAVLQMWAEAEQAGG
jgi:hypothetical protein